MKREGILVVLDFVAESLCYEGFPNRELEAARDFIASALDDAERYRWLKDHCQHVPDELGMAGQLYFGTYAGGELDTAIDTARAAAAGGEG